MSRIGRMPITVPAGVEVTIAENNVVTVKGPKGTLTQALRPEMILEQGHSLAMVEMNPTVGQGIFGVVFNDIYSRIKPYDPEVYTSHRLTAVTDTGVTVEDMATGETKTIAADTVVLAMGTHSQEAMEASYRAAGLNAILVGSGTVRVVLSEPVGSGMSAVRESSTKRVTAFLLSPMLSCSTCSSGW